MFLVLQKIKRIRKKMILNSNFQMKMIMIEVKNCQAKIIQINCNNNNNYNSLNLIDNF